MYLVLIQTTAERYNNTNCRHVCSENHRLSIQASCNMCPMCMYQMHIFYTWPGLALPAAGLFSCSQLRGTQGAVMYTTARAWVPAGLRSACSGRSKPRRAGSFCGIAFRDAEPARTMETPQFQLIFVLSLQLLLSHRPSSSQALHFVTTPVQPQSYIKLLAL